MVIPVTALPPLESNVTFRVFAVHLAKRVRFPVKVTDSWLVYAVPVPFEAVVQPAKVYPVLAKELAVSAVATSVVMDWLDMVPLVELLPLKVTVLVLAVQPANRSMLALGV